MSHKTVTPLLFETYLAVVKNSLGSNLFKNFFAEIGRKKIDVLNNGELSCAFFVSSILALFGWLKKPHATVKKTVTDLEMSGWKKIKRPRVGSIIVWESVAYPDDSNHKHIGFYMGKEMAISHSDKKRTPVLHKWKKGKRRVELIYWNPKF